jgi:hypothetical protein
MSPCLPPSLKLRRPEVQAPAKPWRRRVAGTTIGAFGSVVAKDTPKHSRGASARGLSNSRPSQKDQGRRECRAIDAPAASRAKNEKHTSKSPRITPFSSGIPRANGFNGFLRALPGDRAFLSPSLARCEKHRRQLDASVGAPERHDFAVRSMPFVIGIETSIASRAQRS